MRLWIVLAAVAAVTLILLPFQWISVRLGLSARRRIPQFYHRIVCRLVGVRISVVGARSAQTPLMIVSNHVSWLDISVITAVTPVVFVAKQEVSGWPIFGLLARLQRSVFVDRNQRLKTADVNSEIARRMAEGDPVLLFGEGTSSDGNRVLEFRSALIGATREAIAHAGHVQRVWIQPMSIAYTAMLGLPLGRQHRPLVAWYGDFDLVPHLAGVLRRGSVDVTVTWGTPVSVDETSNRKDLTRNLEAQVRRMTAAALRGRSAA